MYPKIKFLSSFVLLAVAFQTFGSIAYARTSTYSDNSDMSQAQAGLVVKEKLASAAKQAATLAFWSKKSIANARPMPLLAQDGPAVVDQAALSGAEAIGDPGFAAAGVAAPDADRIAQAAYSADWQALGETIDANNGAELFGIEPPGTSEIFTRYIVNLWLPAQKIYPHKWIGRLTFTTPTGNSSCSATSISNNTLLTAAHCVYDTPTNNQFYTNKVFTPAYRDGNAPYGTFPTSQCHVLTAWVNLSGGFAINSWSRHDVAVCKMGLNSAGQTLNDAVGWMGRQWNWPYVRHFHDLGYAGRDFNDVVIANAGKYLRTCVAESFQQTTETRGLGCDLSRGMSGGPWMIAYAPNVISGWADGVNSGFFKGTKNLYGARFNSNNIVPLCAPTAANC